MQKHNWTSKGRWLMLLILSPVLWMACNKGLERVLPPGDTSDTTSSVVRKPKVLVVVLDGARGQSVRDLNTDNISKLTDHAIYSWNTISNDDINGLTPWADLLTGVTKDKHGVSGTDVAGANLGNFPVFFKRIKQRKPETRIAAYTTQAGISDKLITDADENKLFENDDDAVTTAALAELAKDEADMVMLQYSNINNQGKQFGYDLSFPQYRDAIQKADGDIGKLLTAVKARKSYKQEKWLIVIMSSHGGPFAIAPEDDDHTILSNPNINNFVLFYTEDYVPSFIDKPYTGNRYIGQGIRLTGDGVNAVYGTIDGSKNFDIEEKSNLTIELKIKVMPGANGDYTYSNTSVLAKRGTLDAGDPGWAIVLNQKAWQVNLGRNAPGKTDNVIVAGADISDGNWHDIAAVIATDSASGTRMLKTYTDGKLNNSTNISGSGNLNTTAPLTLGYLPYVGSYPAPDAFVTELKIFLDSASAQVMSDYACNTSIPETHPLYRKLIGYWPARDGQGARLKDISTMVTDFQMHGAFSWINFNNLICPASPTGIAQTMPQSIDLSRQIMDWMQVAIDPGWNLDGKVWTTRYVSMINN